MKYTKLGWLLFLALLWGPSFLFIKVAVAEIPPVTMVLIRVGLGGLLLYGMLRLQNGRLPRDRQVWKHLAIIGLIHNAIPFVLFSWGEQYIDSALASILNGTTPLFTIFLAHFFTESDRLTRPKMVGAAIGFGGLILLSLPSLGDGLLTTTLGLLALTVASIMYAVAIVYTRNNLRGLPRLVAPTGQMLMATIYLLPVALLVERPFSLPMPSLTSWGAVLMLAVFGTAIAFWVYYQLMEIADPSYVSLVTYLIPVVGVVLGIVVLNEQLTWHSYAGCGLILFGVMIINGLFRRRARVAPAATAGRLDT